MVQTETIKIIAMIKVAYPKFDNLKTEENMEMAIELWTDMLQDVPFQAVLMSLKKHIANSTWAPSIHDIRENIVDMQQVKTKSAMEAWGDVIKSIRYFGTYREVEAIETLDELTKSVTQAIGYREICMAEELDIVRAHFLKHYAIIQQRQRDDKLTPNWLHAQIREYSQEVKMLEGCG